MKAKVIIEKGLTQIELIPENDFEIDIIEKSKELNPNCDVKFSFGKEQYYSANKDHKITITLKKSEPKQTPQ